VSFPIEANHIDIAKPSGPNDGGVYDAFKTAYIKTFDKKSSQASVEAVPSKHDAVEGAVR
jgi:hypothetical protein